MGRVKIHCIVEGVIHLILALLNESLKFGAQLLHTSLVPAHQHIHTPSVREKEKSKYGRDRQREGDREGGMMRGVKEGRVQGKGESEVSVCETSCTPS